MPQNSSNRSESVTTSSAQVCDNNEGSSLKRTQIIITNTSSSAVITLAKTNDAAAVAGSGIVLQPKQSYYEATDGGFECWQGAYQAVGDASGTLGITETFRG